MPLYFSGSSRSSMLMISTYSRTRVSGRPNGTPWKCSITFGPELPSPMIIRPFDSSSSVPKCCASAPGLREKMFTIEVPSLMLCVSYASTASVVKASRPHASATMI